jgi:Phage Tail Collar Domain
MRAQGSSKTQRIGHGVLAGAALMFGSLMAHAYDTSWIGANQVLSASKLKADLDEAQSRIEALEQATTPPGIIVPYGGTAAPSGWVLCDGAAYNGLDARYSALYRAIGTTFGGSAGAMSFNVPNLAGRFLRGATAANPLGQTGGSDSHTHGASGTTSTVDNAPSKGSDYMWGATPWAGYPGPTLPHSHTISLTTNPGSTLPAYASITYIMKL